MLNLLLGFAKLFLVCVVGMIIIASGTFHDPPELIGFLPVESGYSPIALASISALMLFTIAILHWTRQNVLPSKQRYPTVVGGLLFLTALAITFRAL